MTIPGSITKVLYQLTPLCMYICIYMCWEQPCYPYKIIVCKYPIRLQNTQITHYPHFVDKTVSIDIYIFIFLRKIVIQMQGTTGCYSKRTAYIRKKDIWIGLCMVVFLLCFI